MPTRKRVKAAIRKGTNPYAVCNAQAKKSHMTKAAKERCVRHVTDAALKKKRRKKKG